MVMTRTKAKTKQMAQSKLNGYCGPDGTKWWRRASIAVHSHIQLPARHDYVSMRNGGTRKLLITINLVRW